MPSVEWTPSAPADPHEDSEWVQAVRSYALEWPIAFNMHDFTSPALAETVTASHLARLADELRGFAAKSEYVYFPGPLPFRVVDLAEDDDTAIVTVCEAATGWLVSQDSPDPSTDGATETTYTLSKTDAGKIRIDSIGASDRKCDLSGAAFGLFDPQPDLTPYSVDDVKER